MARHSPGTATRLGGSARCDYTFKLFQNPVITGKTPWLVHLTPALSYNPGTRHSRTRTRLPHHGRSGGVHQDQSASLAVCGTQPFHQERKPGPSVRPWHRTPEHLSPHPPRRMGAHWRHQAAVGSDGEIERTQFGICDQPRGLHRCARTEREDVVIALAVGATSRRGTAAILTESKSSRKRHNAGRQEVVLNSAKANRESHDGTCAAQANEIAAIRPKLPPPGFRPSIRPVSRTMR